MRNKRKRAVCASAATITSMHHNAAYMTLLLAKVIASLLRLLNGQVRQLQTNNH